MKNDDFDPFKGILAGAALGALLFVIIVCLLMAVRS